MTSVPSGDHVIAFIGDDISTVQTAKDAATRLRLRLSIVAVAVVEPERRGCCDLRSGVWNRLQREDAAARLTAARRLTGSDAEFLIAEGATPSEALIRLIERRGARLIVLPDEPRRPLGRRRGLADRVRRATDVVVTTPGASTADVVTR
jgi:hypothetical protein